MKRVLSIVALVAALTLGTGAHTIAHELYVTTPNGKVVLVNHDLAKGTPSHPDGNGSAASHGTNTACLAVPEDGPVLIAANNGICPPVPPPS